MRLSTSLFLLLGCVFTTVYSQEKNQQIVVKNKLNVSRSFETVELSKSFLKRNDLSSLGIIDAKTNEKLTTQVVDTDGDGTFDVLLFQPKMEAKSKRVFSVIKVSKDEKSEKIDYCYSRFVPERTDDYTWENNKVAFRIYGPTAQKMIEDKVKGGTLSSGVDAWLKKVEYPVINSWYKKTTEGNGSYHKDTGEGLDNFHVGVSRGVGGIAIKKDSKYFYSKNYTKWRTITTGPIRTSFYVEYANWDVDGNKITESKIISLDYGNNLSKFETKITGTKTISAGLTLHEKDGIVTGNDKKGWLSYWQPHLGSELGTAIVASKKHFKSHETYDTKAVDESNAYAHLKVKNDAVTYYAGFSWKESNQYTTSQQWEDYLTLFAKKINKPLQVRLK